MDWLKLFGEIAVDAMSRSQLKKEYPNDLPIFDYLSMKVETVGKIYFDKIPGTLGLASKYVGGILNAERVHYFILMHPSPGEVFHAWKPDIDLTKFSHFEILRFVNWLNSITAIGQFSESNDKSIRFCWGYPYKQLSKEAIANLSQTFTVKFIKFRKVIRPILVQFKNGKISYNPNEYTESQKNLIRIFSQPGMEIKKDNPLINYLIGMLGEKNLLYEIDNDVISINHPSNPGIKTGLRMYQSGKIDICTNYSVFSTNKVMEKFILSEYLYFLNSTGLLTDVVYVDTEAKSLVNKSSIYINNLALESQKSVISQLVDNHVLSDNAKFTEVGRLENDIDDQDVFSDMVDQMMGIGDRFHYYFQPLSENPEKSKHSFMDVPAEEQEEAEVDQVNQVKNNIHVSEKKKPKQNSNIPPTPKPTGNNSSNNRMILWIVIGIVAVGVIGMMCMCLIFTLV